MTRRLELDESWKAYGACVGTDPNLFFAEKWDHDTNRKAKAVCQRCPVREQCLSYAVEHAIKSGIFGGLSERERRRVRIARNRARRVQRITEEAS